jgi:hypothetical protein
MKNYTNYSLLPYNTFGMDVKAARFVEYESVNELLCFLKEWKAQKTPLLHVGRGSNLLFVSDYQGTVLHSGIKGMQVVSEIDEWVKILISLLLGIGFGTMFPAYNTLFVNLAPNSQRGTATSTYLTSWDVGLGIGMLTGGYLAEIATFKIAYLFGASLTVVSLLYFHLKAGPHFEKNRLR